MCRMIRYPSASGISLSQYPLHAAMAHRGNLGRPAHRSLLRVTGGAFVVSICFAAIIAVEMTHNALGKKNPPSAMAAGFLVFRNGSIRPLNSRRSRSAKKRRHQLQGGEIKLLIVIATKARAGHQKTGRQTGSSWWPASILLWICFSAHREWNLSRNFCL